jgi:hypothetical protein
MVSFSQVTEAGNITEGIFDSSHAFYALDGKSNHRSGWGIQPP